MAIYLLTWNPTAFEWREYLAFIDATKSGQTVDYPWSTGNRINMAEGERVFLIRQGTEPRGIIASGTTISEPYAAEHWNPERDDEAYYVSPLGYSSQRR